MTTTESDTCFHAALDAEDATHPEGDFAKQTETPAAHETDEDNHLSGVKEMNKRALAAVALLSEADAAKVFNMGTTRFKARCRALGIARWPHRKLMSLKNLYTDLIKHLERATDAGNEDQCRRVREMMREIKTYARTLEDDLSRLNQFYNGKRAWPENILKIRQTVYKKRHAQVLVDKRKLDVEGQRKKAKICEETVASDAPTRSSEPSDSHASFGSEYRDVAGPDAAIFDLNMEDSNLTEQWANSETEDMWWFLARGEHSA